MSILTESIETIRAEQLRILAEKEAKEKADAEAMVASRAARQAEMVQIYTRCQNIIDESRLVELFDEVNREVFKGTGKTSKDMNNNPRHHNVGLGDWRLDRIDFSVRMGIKGLIDKTPTLLTADATISESPDRRIYSPTLTIKCQVGKQATILDRVLGRKVEWNCGSSETLRERVLEKQDQSVKEWQNLNSVAKLTAKVLLKAGVV